MTILSCNRPLHHISVGCYACARMPEPGASDDAVQVGAGRDRLVRSDQLQRTTRQGECGCVRGHHRPPRRRDWRQPDTASAQSARTGAGSVRPSRLIGCVRSLPAFDVRTASRPMPSGLARAAGSSPGRCRVYPARRLHHLASARSTRDSRRPTGTVRIHCRTRIPRTVPVVGPIPAGHRTPPGDPVGMGPSIHSGPLRSPGALCKRRHYPAARPPRPPDRIARPRRTHRPNTVRAPGDLGGVAWCDGSGSTAHDRGGSRSDLDRGGAADR